MLDLNAIDAQFKPLEDGIGPLKAAWKAWATAVNALAADMDEDSADLKALNAAQQSVQTGPFANNSPAAVRAWADALEKFQAADAAIGPLRAAVDAAFVTRNNLLADWNKANDNLRINPGQVEAT